MARIEELSDQLSSSLNLFRPDASSQPPPHPPFATAASASTPSPIPPKALNNDSVPLPTMPPLVDSVRSHTTEEIMQLMNRTPLFMTSLEDTDDGTPSPFPIVYHQEERVHLKLQTRHRERRA